jgi:hypothetical protein
VRPIDGGVYNKGTAKLLLSPPVAYLGAKVTLGIVSTKGLPIDTTDERRAAERFQTRIPVTVLAGELSLPAFTKDLSARGVYFYVSSADSHLIEQDLDFIIEFPPAITRCNKLKARCTGKVLRKQITIGRGMGIAAEFCRYTFMNDTAPS